MKGFYVTGSRSGSYVANKRNEEGSFTYDTSINELGLQKQAALQELGKTYDATVNKAYASYLANQRTINTSAMGEGYKEAYKAAEEANLLSQIAEANVNATNVRAQLDTQEAKAQKEIAKQYETEVANLDRVARTMDEYLDYVKKLSDDYGGTYLTAEQSGMNIDDLYEVLYTAQPRSLYDEEGNPGLSYSQWIHSQMKDTEADLAFERWLFSGGGWQDFIKATSK
jgi:hypothetical protein